MVAAELTVTYDRSKVVEFTSTYYLESYGILIQVPKQNSGRDTREWRFSFLFSPTVWGTAIVGCVTSFLFIFILHKMYDKAEEASSTVDLILNCFFYVFYSAVNQGATTRLNAWSSRAFIAFFQLFIVCIIATYSGSLVSLFATSRNVLAMKDLPSYVVELKNGNIKTCLIESSAFQSAVMASKPGEPLSELREYLQDNPKSLGSSLDDCIKRLLADPAMTMLGELVALENIQNQYCATLQLSILNEQFFPGFFALAFPKSSQFTEIFSLGVVETIESGLLDMWKVKYMTKPSFCEIFKATGQSTPTMNALNMTELVGAFLVLAGGAALGLLMFVGEWKNNCQIKTRIIRKQESSVTVISTM